MLLENFQIVNFCVWKVCYTSLRAIKSPPEDQKNKILHYQIEKLQPTSQSFVKQYLQKKYLSIDKGFAEIMKSEWNMNEINLNEKWNYEIGWNVLIHSEIRQHLPQQIILRHAEWFKKAPFSKFYNYKLLPDLPVLFQYITFCCIKK